MADNKYKCHVHNIQLRVKKGKTSAASFYAQQIHTVIRDLFQHKHHSLTCAMTALLYDK